jgi:hypothetical protein
MNPEIWQITLGIIGSAIFVTPAYFLSKKVDQRHDKKNNQRYINSLEHHKLESYEHDKEDFPGI